MAAAKTGAGAIESVGEPVPVTVHGVMALKQNTDDVADVDPFAFLSMNAKATSALKPFRQVGIHHSISSAYTVEHRYERPAGCSPTDPGVAVTYFWPAPTAGVPAPTPLSTDAKATVDVEAQVHPSLEEVMKAMNDAKAAADINAMQYPKHTRRAFMQAQMQGAFIDVFKPKARVKDTKVDSKASPTEEVSAKD